MRINGSIFIAVIAIASVQVQGGEYPTWEQKTEVRSVVRQVVLISRASTSLDEVGKRSLKQSTVILKIGAPAVYALSLYLSDSDWKVRYWIADMLGYLENPDARRPLLRLINNDQNETVRQRAQRSLGMVQNVSEDKKNLQP
jgi:HEAT repeat protein